MDTDAFQKGREDRFNDYGKDKTLSLYIQSIAAGTLVGILLIRI